GGPDGFAPGGPARGRQEVEHEPEEPGPTVRDRDGSADQLGDQRLERVLDRGGDLLLRRELRGERRVAEAAGEQAAVGRLLPVVEAVAAVVGTFEEPLG